VSRQADSAKLSAYTLFSWSSNNISRRIAGLSRGWENLLFYFPAKKSVLLPKRGADAFVDTKFITFVARRCASRKIYKEVIDCQAFILELYFFSELFLPVISVIWKLFVNYTI